MEQKLPVAVTTTVYSLYYPETERVVSELWASQPHDMYRQNYTKRQDLMHEPFFRRWRSWSGVTLDRAFPLEYPTNGASEAIDHLIVPPGRIHVFEGEYEGYAAIARARGMEVRQYARTPDPHHSLSVKNVYSPGVGTDTFFVSLPSSIDGEYWHDFDKWCDALYAINPTIKVVVDVTYVGAVRNIAALDPARHPNVAAVIFSLSKPFGVYYHRIGGVVSRSEIPSLYGNRWFKNLFSLRLGTMLMARYPVDFLPRMYAHVQREALELAVSNSLVPASTTASNVVLLARGGDGADAHKRALGAYRFCLTPLMDRMINPEGETP